MDEDKVLIIGGNGFIGEYLSAELAKNKINFFVFDRNSREKLEDAVSQVNTVAFLLPPNKDLLQKTLTLVSQKENPTFLYTSTLLLYKDSEEIHTEKDELFPITDYAKEKMAEEEMILDFKKNYPKINITIARLGNAYGDKKNKGFVGLVIKSLLENGTITIAGDGSQVRDFVFVEDVVKALSLLLLKKEDVGIINISTGVGTTLLQAINCIEKITEKKIDYHFGQEMRETYLSIGDNNKLKNLFNWVPEISIEDGLRKTYKNYIMNKQ